MKEEVCNIWDKHVDGHWVCITTNNYVNGNNECVMGRGVARQAKLRYPELPKKLGELILDSYRKYRGEEPFMFGTVMFPEYRIITFPTKFLWWQSAHGGLILHSAQELLWLLEHNRDIERVYLPRPGCSNGKLLWKNVKPILESVFSGDDRVIAVTNK